MKRLQQGALVSVGLVALLVPWLATTSGVPARAVDPTVMEDEQEELLSGFASYEFNSAAGDSSPSAVRDYTPRGSQDCGYVNSSNVKVNQNCLALTDPDLQGRGQAQNETSIAQDPNNPNHLIATYNDYRRGDGNCGASYSLDKGRTWNDALPPTSFTRGNGPNRANFG